ncbi:MAG: FAD-binding oxidoreductase, partial [Deltaproteobacteria bacterium]|nr:FAD-binding oxidoreductase [Deltaproteobacteria bacterium]
MTTPEDTTDVCIVGAGIAGLTTALTLVRRGARVMVLDDGPFGDGETGRTTAHLASAVDARFYKLERSLGPRAAQLVAESHSAAIDAIEHNVRELDIDCEFKRVAGYLYAPPGSARSRRADRELDRELRAATRAGLIVERVEEPPLPFEVGPALRFANQAQFHPMKYLRGLADAVIALGGTIHEGIHVRAIEPGTPLEIVTVDERGERRIRAQVAVDATNATITSPVKLTTRVGAYRTYVLAFDVLAGHIPQALYWDTGDPYHYLRLAPGEP